MIQRYYLIRLQWLGSWIHKHTISFYYRLCSLSVFSLAKSLQLILQISATSRSGFRAQSMISMCNVKLGTLVPEVFLENFLYERVSEPRSKKKPLGPGYKLCSVQWWVWCYLKKKMYNKTIIRFSFYDIWNNQGHSKCYISLGLRQG